MPKFIFSFLLFLVYCSFYGQSEIEGIIKNASENVPLDNVSVILYNDTQNQILEYTYSDDQGFFEFQKSVTEGIYRLEFSKMGFEKLHQKVVIGTDADKHIEVNISLKTQAFSLDEVTIATKDPIIVKKDTILYDIAKLKHKHDETLEEVLVKIEGFSIKADGTIEVNGKTIQKVLIDGKETTDFGNALLTKSLGADKVDNVEVRFDEKNKKIKESLLDDEKFVVLDIRLKKDFDQSLFGKQQLRLGYENNAKIGGLTNLFSLNGKINIQFFAEVDHFGRNEIELKQIRNIGAEAFQKMLSTPNDINDIKEREGYQEEIYGFDSFIKNDKSIAGISVNIPISKKTDLYLGSFNDYHFLKNQFSRDLFHNNELFNHYEENNQIREYNSKNKLQLKHSSENWKINTDLNYVYADQVVGSNAQSDFLNAFKKNHYANDVYFNHKMEHQLTEKIGVSEAFSYARENFKLNPTLKTEDLQVLNFFGLDAGSIFTQQNKNIQSILNNDFNVVYNGGVFGNHSIGYQYTKNKLDNQKQSNAQAFAALKHKNWTETHSVKYKGSVFLGPVYINLTLKESIIDFPYPTFSTNRRSKAYFEYNAIANYDFGTQTDLSLSGSREVALFPLQKISLGNLLTDFQTVVQPSSAIKPYYNTNYSASFSKVFHKKGEILLMYLYGQSDNMDDQVFDHHLIINRGAQLSNRFHLISTQFEKKFLYQQLKIRLEPELIINSSEFTQNGSINNSKSYQYLAGLKVDYQVNNKLSLFYYPKYSHFIFKNSGEENPRRTFDFLTNNFTAETYLIDRNLKLQANFKQVNFLKDHSDFNNLDFKAIYKWKKFRVFAELNNLFNSKNFITQELDRTFLNRNNNTVFGRFINVGVEVKIN